MKLVILGVFCFFAICRANSAIPDSASILKRKLNAIDEINFDILPKELVNRINFFTATDVLSGSHIQVVINQYADEIFKNLQKFVRSHNLNSISIPDAHLSLDPAGHINLSNGKLEDLDTLSRNEDVELIYEAENKKIILVFSIKFGDLKFFYDHHTKVLLISVDGGVEGTIENIKVNAVLSFSFSTYSAALDHYDMKDSGKVTVKFTGNPIVDWLTNAMAAVVSTFLGQVVVNVIAKMIRDNLRVFVDQLNDAISKILNH